MTDIRPLVLDFGSGLCKAGFAGEPIPRLIYQSCVQRQTVDEKSSIWVGNEDLAHGHMDFPIEHGIVTDWDNIEHVWRHAFGKLFVKPEDQPILVTEAPLNPKSTREKIAEFMFEKFQVPALYFANTAMMCFHTLDLDTCVILEMGDGVMSSVPIQEGDILKEGVLRNDFAGRDLTKSLRRLLDGNGQNSWNGFSSEERFSKKGVLTDVVRMAKEKHCYVAEEFQMEKVKNIRETSYRILAKRNSQQSFQVMMGQEKFSCPEALFDPTMIALSAKGIHKLTVASIEKSGCDANIRQNLYANIVLCGGTAQLPGLVKRLKKEIVQLTSTTVDVNIVSSTDLNCVWTGASAFASNPIFRQMCANKDKYEEFGAKYLHDMTERKSHINIQAFMFSS